MAAKKTAPARGASEYKSLDLALPPGEWWRPWEDGDEVLEVTLQRVKSGQYGDYFVARDAEGLTWFINAHAMLYNLRNMMGRTVRITYTGFDENQGRNGTYMYTAEQLVRAGRRHGRNSGPAETSGDS